MRRKKKSQENKQQTWFLFPISRLQLFDDFFRRRINSENIVLLPNPDFKVRIMAVAVENANMTQMFYYCMFKQQQKISDFVKSLFINVHVI